MNFRKPLVKSTETYPTLLILLSSLVFSLSTFYIFLSDDFYYAWSRERERERERYFCTIDLHPIDKLENASRQSEKNEELLRNGRHGRKILAKICKYILLFIDQQTSYLIFPNFI